MINIVQLVQDILQQRYSKTMYVYLFDEFGSHLSQVKSIFTECEEGLVHCDHVLQRGNFASEIHLSRLSRLSRLSPIFCAHQWLVQRRAG